MSEGAYAFWDGFEKRWRVQVELDPSTARAVAAALDPDDAGSDDLIRAAETAEDYNRDD